MSPANPQHWVRANSFAIVRFWGSSLPISASDLVLRGYQIWRKWDLDIHRESYFSKHKTYHLLYSFVQYFLVGRTHFGLLGRCRSRWGCGWGPGLSLGLHTWTIYHTRTPPFWFVFGLFGYKVGQLCGLLGLDSGFRRLSQRPTATRTPAWPGCVGSPAWQPAGWRSCALVCCGLVLVSWIGTPNCFIFSCLRCCSLTLLEHLGRAGLETCQPKIGLSKYSTEFLCVTSGPAAIFKDQWFYHFHRRFSWCHPMTLWIYWPFLP